MKNFISNILAYKKIASIHIHLSIDGEYEMHLSCLLRKRNKIEIDFQKSTKGQIEELKDLLPKGIPLVLTLTGSGVLNKDFPESEGAMSLSKFYPENKHGDFYCFEVKNESHIGISLCRSEVLDNIANKIDKKSNPLIGILLGPYSLINLWKLNLSNSPQIPFHSGTLRQNITNKSFTFIPEEYDNNSVFEISGKKIDTRYLLAHTVGLITILAIPSGKFIQRIPDQPEFGYKYKRLVSATKFYLLGLILSILGINFWVYENYRSKDSILQEQLLLNNSIIMKRDSLRSVMKAKEEYLKILGNNKTFYSLMLDEIASTVPRGIKLNSLEINPLSSKPQKGDALNFDHKISICGFARNTLILNEWEHQLANIVWIKESEILRFERELNSDRGEFDLEIIFDDEQ